MNMINTTIVCNLKKNIVQMITGSANNRLFYRFDRLYTYKLTEISERI